MRKSNKIKRQSSYSATGREDLIKRLEALQHIAVVMLKELDAQKLLNLIVKKAQRLLLGDAGTLYIKGPTEHLVFQISFNESLNVSLEKTTIPLDRSSLATHCFYTSQSLRISDVYALNKGTANATTTTPYNFDKSFDEKYGYRTKSVLMCPLTNSRKENLGVIQIINRKQSVQQQWPSQDEAAIAQMPEFSAEDEELLNSFASLASIALENIQLHENIGQLLEGFVRASVGAIESRDLTTSGHSERVAILTTHLAETISSSREASVKSIYFSEQQIKELRYASLLHDFGKIGVNERIILKAEKLYPEQKERVGSRVKEFGHVSEIHLLRQTLNKLKQENRGPTLFECARLEKDIKMARQQVEDYWQKILQLNTTHVLDYDNSLLLDFLKTIEMPLLDNKLYPLLEGPEIDFLSIKRGSVSDAEREEINRHVTYSYVFLNKIPWTKDFQQLTEIAYAHHEKLDGTGYPRGLLGDDIPLQSRIMTISDIFDALVAWDRPYKKAVPIAKALDILQMDAREQKLDQRFVRLFIEAKVYENPNFINLMGKKTHPSPELCLQPPAGNTSHQHKGLQLVHSHDHHHEKPKDDHQKTPRKSKKAA